jgi:hypothetical protein
MSIEIGKVYEINAVWKKQTIEIEQFWSQDEQRGLNTEILWRNGTFLVRPTNQEEVDYLLRCEGEDGDIWDSEAFTHCELMETYDGIAEDFIFGSGWDDDEQEQMENMYEEQLESDDYESRYEFLENRGYHSTECDFQIHGGINIEPSEHTMFT